tara:strand:- start:2314 stop:2889 length:576 start_codon:yes stop_codon:yes gene_type:complete
MILPEPLQTVKRLGHKAFTVGEYNVNIVAIRNDITPQVNAFDDFITITFKSQGKWVSYWYPATTDPGLFYLQHPMKVSGTAILKEGQYRGSHKLGLHKGKPGLVQIKPVDVYRDGNRDEYHDPYGEIESSVIGLNVHRAGTNSVVVGRWSAGCVVFANEVHADDFLAICEESAKLYGDNFTLTLVKASELA